MCMPLMASLMDEEEITGLLRVVAGLMRARNPESSELLIAAAKEAMVSLDSITVADGSLTVSEEELSQLIEATQQRMTNNLDQSKFKTE